MSTEWVYASAQQLLKALQQGVITSRGLLEGLQARHEQFHGRLNAVVATDFNAAFERADAADLARQQGESWGPLHGLPMTVKDTYEVVGMPCTAGASALAKYEPKKHAFAVDKLLGAGAIVFGKTNVPRYASDIQSYNAVYGTTNNPWDPARTPGGSSGGSAAALAAGLTPVELGSDIAGSIRTPAHFCGVYGHKPTYGTISMRGHVPGPPGTLQEPALACAGPLARSAEDLTLLLDVLVGPGPGQGPYWSLDLPAATQERLSDFKILWWMDDPECPIDEGQASVYRDLQSHLRQQGVTVTIGSPAGLALKDIVPTYLSMLGSVTGAGLPARQKRMTRLLGEVLKRGGSRMRNTAHGERLLLGMTQRYSDWLGDNERRLHMQTRVAQAFEQFDLILMPVAPVPAFEHMQDVPIGRRRIQVNGEQRPYIELFAWCAMATLLDLPATSLPVGQTAAGLPVNVQVVGAAYQDKTALRFAALVEQALGGFRAPPGYPA